MYINKLCIYIQVSFTGCNAMEKFPLKGTTLSNNTIPQYHQHTLTTYQSVDTKVKINI